MTLVIRMKSVSRFLIFMGSLLLWAVVLLLANDLYFNVTEEVLLVGALLLGVVQTWVVATVLGT